MTEDTHGQIERVVGIATASLLTMSVALNGLSDWHERVEVPLVGIGATAGAPMGMDSRGDMTGIAEVWTAVAVASTASPAEPDYWEITNTVTGVTYIVHPYTKPMQIIELVVDDAEKDNGAGA
jgi:hypothetical protein